MHRDRQPSCLVLSHQVFLRHIPCNVQCRYYLRMFRSLGDRSGYRIPDKVYHCYACQQNDRRGDKDGPLEFGYRIQYLRLVRCDHYGPVCPFYRHECIVHFPALERIAAHSCFFMQDLFELSSHRRQGSVVYDFFNGVPLVHDPFLVGMGNYRTPAVYHVGITLVSKTDPVRNVAQCIAVPASDQDPDGFAVLFYRYGIHEDHLAGNTAHQQIRYVLFTGKGFLYVLPVTQLAGRSVGVICNAVRANDPDVDKTGFSYLPLQHCLLDIPVHALDILTHRDHFQGPHLGLYPALSQPGCFGSHRVKRLLGIPGKGPGGYPD